MLTADGLIALVTLTVLEVVLGIDNVIFISILAGKLPKENQEKARRIGLMGAMGMRILLLMSLAWMTRLTAPLFTIMVVNRPIAGRDLILIIGGLFLLFKATREIHDKLEGEEGHVSARVAPTLAAVITQIMLLDIVFSLDSVITAVGMADDLSMMVAAVVIAVAHHDVRGAAGQRVRGRAPDREGAGAQLPAADRLLADRRRASACTFRRATSTSRWASRCSSR